MSSVPDWLRDDDQDPEMVRDAHWITILGVVAWIAGIAALADCLYVAQRFVG